MVATYENNEHRRWKSFDKPRLMRDMERKKIAGVCAGLASYWGTETWVVRVATVVAGLFFAQVVIIAYIIAWLLLPRSDDAHRGERTRRPDVSNHDPVAPEFGGRYAGRKSLRTLAKAFQEIDRRIGKLEQVVTDPNFSVYREFNKL